MPLRTLALGIGGLFGFHFLLFMALRLAPPLEANLVNYLWPLLIVLLTPLVLPGWPLARRHVAAAIVGFAGAALAIGASPATIDTRSAIGFSLAAGSALTWALYSLLTRRVAPFSTWAIGGFAAASARWRCYVTRCSSRPRRSRPGRAKLAALGLGPMGAAFYLWDYAMKRGDPRVVGTLAYATPVLSTALLALATGRALSLSLGARDAAGRGRRGDRASGPQVGPARLLLLHDLDDAGLHVADAASMSSFASFWLVIVFSHATTLTPAPIASAMRLAATESAFSIAMPGP